jgi:hypothetical protein
VLSSNEALRKELSDTYFEMVEVGDNSANLMFDKLERKSKINHYMDIT